MSEDLPMQDQIWFHVDDDQDDLMLYREIIEELLPEVILQQFSSSFDLLRRLNSGRVLPRILLIDLNMPIVDGLTCLKHVRILPGASFYTRLVMLSTNIFKETIDKCHSSGAHFYACKPSNLEDLRKLFLKIKDIGNSEFTCPLSKRNFLINP